MTEHLSPVFRTETARHFLFQFDYTQVPFGLNVVKRHLKAEIKDQEMTQEQFEERKSLILSILDHAPKDELVMDAPFEFKQRIIKLVVDKIG